MIHRTQRPESLGNVTDDFFWNQMTDERRQQLGALVRADWRAGLVCELVRLDSTEPDTRFSALSAAFAFGVRVEDLPSKIRRGLGDLLVVSKAPRPDVSTFIRKRMAKQSLGSPRNNVAHAIVAEVIRAPHCFEPDELADLMVRIKSQASLFRRALSHPMFISFPDGLRHCLDGARNSNESIASTALAVLIECWPEQLESVRDLIISSARSSRYLLRLAAVPALARISAAKYRSDVVDLLRSLLSDPESVVRKESLAVLVQIVGAAATPELTVALRDPAMAVRVEACQQIAGLKDATFVDLLRERVIDADSSVRRAAFVAIAQLSLEAAAQSAGAFLRRGG